MSDYLVELGQNPLFKRAVQTLGLPLPIPEPLQRQSGAWRETFLSGQIVAVNDAAKKDIKDTITQAGARIESGDDAHGIVFDARNLKTVEDLEQLYKFAHDHIRKLAKSGRLIVIARSAGDDTAGEAAATSAATLGFIKSCAKEIGRKGATANAIFVAKDADKWLPSPLRFLLSHKSAFVDGQPIAVTKPRIKAAKPTWDKQLQGKTALVTGAARGIGAATAARLATEGAHVIGLDIPAAAEDLQATVRGFGGTALTCDITDKSAVKTILKAAEPLGGLDIVVNNAGITRDKTLANMTPEHWNMALSVNLKAALNISQGVLPHFDKDGRVICLSSIAGIAGNFGQTNYGAAKAGLIGAVRRLADEFAENGATINAVAPGFIETKMTAAVPFTTREAGRRISCLGQGGLPEDVAELITFLTTPAAAGINGQIIRVCGGSFLGA